MLQPNPLPDPWAGFLRELDNLITEPVCLHCLGGFVVNMFYGFTRPTGDIDFLQVVPQPALQAVSKTTNEGGALHKKYGIYLDRVTVAHVPESYEDRLSEMFAGEFKNLRLMALDPYDVALAKLERNIERDRNDVRFLARTIPFDLEVLDGRYKQELRPFVNNTKRADLTMELWLEMIQEDRGSTPPT
jgi:Nucleotidyltransferase of unknown function (DUF6036)